MRPLSKNWFARTPLMNRPSRPRLAVEALEGRDAPALFDAFAATIPVEQISPPAVVAPADADGDAVGFHWGVTPAPGDVDGFHWGVRVG